MCGQVLMIVLPKDAYMSVAMQNNLHRYGGRQDRVWPEQITFGMTPARVLYETVVPNRYLWNGNYYFSQGSWETEVVVQAVAGTVVYGMLASVLIHRSWVLLRRSYGVPRRPV